MSSTPTLIRLARPTIPDAELWGPYLRQCWLEGTACYVEEMTHARRVLATAPHGTIARVGQWAMFGQDPGQPCCTCCERRPAGEA